MSTPHVRKRQRQFEDAFKHLHLSWSAEEAKANAPCVIFIDELDSVGGKRIESPMHPYSRQTINQLLAEMDGLVFRISLFSNFLSVNEMPT